MKNTDERLQMPIYWGELSEDAQVDLVDELAGKWGVRRHEVRAAMLRMDHNGETFGFITVQEYDIKKVLDEL